MDGNEIVVDASAVLKAMRAILSVVGFPGAGKSTISRALGARLSAPVLSTGDALRDLSVNDKALAVALASGLLGPEEVVRRLVDEFLQSVDVAILDGYPRHRDQAKYLLGLRTSLTIGFLDIDLGVATARIRQRPARGDESETAVQQRLHREQETLQEVLQTLKKHTIRLDAKEPPDKIVDQIVRYYHSTHH